MKNVEKNVKSPEICRLKGALKDYVFDITFCFNDKSKAWWLVRVAFPDFNTNDITIKIHSLKILQHSC